MKNLPILVQLVLVVCATHQSGIFKASTHETHYVVWSMMSLKVIHFQSIFLIYFYLKRLIYMQKYGITNQTVMQQGIQEKEEFLQKKGQKVDEHH